MSELCIQYCIFAQLTRLIARLVKTRRFDVDEKVLRTFLSLRIKEIHKKEDDVTESRRVKKERLKIMSRREKKVKQREKFKRKAQREAEVAKLNPALGNKHAKEKALRQLTKMSEHGNDVTIIQVRFC